MTRHRFIIAACALLLASCSPQPDRIPGYVEGEFVLLAPTTGGLLQTLKVEKGQTVKTGQDLFTLDLTELNARREAANADYARAQATLESARKEYDRVLPLSKSGAASQSAVDQARAGLDVARSDVDAARQGVTQTEKQIADAARRAPADGVIADTFFRAGEYVAPGQPVVSLLPPDNVKIRFFVPQATVSQLSNGQTVRVNCDGCGAPITAKITYVATETEYAPPIIYSVESRDKLVFLIEATPDAHDARLRPGLPVDIQLGQ